MPQIFQVLRCYKCAVFQIHPTKKSNKFQCKMCGEKQSIKRHYGIGTGKDCRLHVQKLNGLRGDMIHEMEENYSSHGTSEEDEAKPCVDNTKILHSKWSDFVEDAPSETHDENEPMYLDNTEVVLDIPKKRAKRSQNRSNYKPSVNKRYVNKNTNDLDDNQDDSDITTLNCNDIIDEINSMSNNRTTNKPQVKFVAPLVKIQTENNTEACVKIKDTFKELKNTSDNTIKEEKKTLRRDFVQPKINTNSKWAQFVEDEEPHQIDEDGDEFNNDDGESVSDPKALFSLCDDAGVDNVSDSDPNALFSLCDNVNLGELSASDPKALFSLCDDADLDNVLNI